MQTIEKKAIQQHIRDFTFAKLFVEELGWNPAQKKSHTVKIGGDSFTLKPIAEQGGMLVMHCQPLVGAMPPYNIRRKIEKEAGKIAAEHIVIFCDLAQTQQIWQWTKREPGQPVRCREYRHSKGQDGLPLILKLRNLLFTFDDFSHDGEISIIDVRAKTRAGFDVETVTKKFYERFKKEHDAFLKFIAGIPDEHFHHWYVSVMLNRLMFIYFIQKRGFLNNDLNYLRTRLAESKAKGPDRYYQHFLIPLFFEGFAKRENERSQTMNKMLGQIPYLHGGLFLQHEVEQKFPKISIPDVAFEQVFSFFEQYQWHLDERPVEANTEINPDVLGYIFEKYINQKQMGAYYTKEDITEYISKNTVIPFLFDAAKAKCRIAFEGESTVWRLLQENPDRYIYESVRKGTDISLPEDIAAGIENVVKRTGWNKPAPEEFALPTEIWREVVARRQRYEEIRGKLRGGEVREINDLITYNLDIRQFAQDVIENCEGPELLRAFWHAIQKITVLDPTCGSGAFLFAALGILDVLYEACLDRMQVFVDELDASGEAHSPKKFSDFRETLVRTTSHTNRRYFVLKSIMVNNLYGVDIMEEATEICKLRLFLKLVSQVERVEDIEPLPDIDFNIRAGNTLVGYASLDGMHPIGKQDFLGFDDINEIKERIQEQAGDIARLFERFQEMQIAHGMASQDFMVAKIEIQNRLKSLEMELNQYLAEDYKIDRKKQKVYVKWLESHRPFHWCIEFFDIMQQGGFDVIIGNPPYVEYGKVRNDYTVKGYSTESCGNLYAFILERNNLLLRTIDGRSGMIVPHSGFCTDRMAPLVNTLKKGRLWVTTFCIRPAKLFNGVDQRLAVYFLHRGVTEEFISSNYHHWHEEFRPYLFNSICWERLGECVYKNSVPKLQSRIEVQIWGKLHSNKSLAAALHGEAQLFYHNAPRYWIRGMTFHPYFWNQRDGEQLSTQVKTVRAGTQVQAAAIAALLNSNLFFWWFVALSDCRHLNSREIELFPLDLSLIGSAPQQTLVVLCAALMQDLKNNAVRKECQYKATGKVVYDEFYPRHSKSIIDEIDCVLAKHYDFTDEELDFIINYDIKYRMGLSGASGDEETEDEE